MSFSSKLKSPTLLILEKSRGGHIVTPKGKGVKWFRLELINTGKVCKYKKRTFYKNACARRESWRKATFNQCRSGRHLSINYALGCDYQQWQELVHYERFSLWSIIQALSGEWIRARHAFPTVGGKTLHPRLSFLARIQLEDSESSEESSSVICAVVSRCR